MADIYMHARLTEELIKELDYDIDLNIALLGSQGPDPLYYIQTKTYHDIANYIHRHETRKFFQTMVTYIKQHYNKTTKSFLFGFLSHYVMDQWLHPYVYYHTGVYKKDKQETHHMRGLHLKFERSIDCLLIQKELQIPSRKLNLTKKYFPLKSVPNDVSDLMRYTLKTEFKLKETEDMYDRSVKTMYRVLKYMVTDRFGIKKQIYKLIDVFDRKSDMFKQDISFFRHLEKYDFHNDKRNTWYHPLSNVPTNQSVEMLFSEAKSAAKQLITNTIAYLEGTKEIALEDIFLNHSYNTGMDCELGMDFKHIAVYRR